MKTRQQHIDGWNEMVENGKTGQNVILDVLLDIHELLQESNKLLKKKNEVIEVIGKEKEEQEGCSVCGLKKKYWNKMLCGESGDHKE